MTIFAEKLARLPETILLVGARGATDLAEALRDGGGRMVVAIGSGGSVVAAEFLARCRTTLGLGHTAVMTPMQFVLSLDEWDGCDLWLFSASANNPDISAAFKRAVASRARGIRLLTVRDDGCTTLAAAGNKHTTTYVLPVADPKDGFLATHSMVAMATGLLLASDLLIECPNGPALIDAFSQAAKSALLEWSTTALAVKNFRPGDTVVLLHDPQLSTVAILLETSLWETGIAPVQRTDFRNFAHGRHVWAARHPTTMFILALTGSESADVWAPIATALPADLRRGVAGFGNTGRLQNAIGVINGLAMIRSLGAIVGTDPGRPGHGSFAEAIFENPALEVLAHGLTPAVRHKTTAQKLYDPLGNGIASVCAIGRDRLRAIAETRFVGVALDYDGTIVATDARLKPPDHEVLDEIVRLVDAGIQVGIATGRGGSAGEMLRNLLPERVHPSIIMGYYNGAHVRSLEVDIKLDQPEQDPVLLQVADWIDGKGLLRYGRQLGRGRVQLTINHDDVVNEQEFAQRIFECRAVLEGRVSVLSSHHSFDIVPSGTSKLHVVRALAERAGSPGSPVLGIGDSGSPQGNDHELLSGQHGISVDTVCGSLDGCWSMFGSQLKGPAALLRILRATRPGLGGALINVNALGLDISC